MFPFVIGGLAVLLFFWNPIVELITSEGGARRLPRTSRPIINETLLAIDAANDTAPLCPPDSYVVHIYSKAPLVLYIENFMEESEIEHLLEISEPLFAPSTITADGSATHRDTIVRDSSVALVPRTDAVRCLERRALALQGWRDDVWIERLRTQRYYGAGRQHYAHHYDWGSGARGWGRVSTLMAWVAADDGDDPSWVAADDGGPFRGGGTEFPLMPRRTGVDDRWCRWIECPEQDEGGAGDEGQGPAGPGLDPELPLGVTFKPVRGNAVYWENFKPDRTGRGWEETWHAGLPVERGTKVGLNIWSWGRLE